MNFSEIKEPYRRSGVCANESQRSTELRNGSAARASVKPYHDNACITGLAFRGPRSDLVYSRGLRRSGCMGLSCWPSPWCHPGKV